MPALDNLSIAANVFQVVSFTDTVFRAGQALYELFNRARAASKNIAQLLLTLHALLSVIAHVRAFITDYASSPFAQEDGHALPHLRTILTLIEQDFRHIRGLLVETMGIGNEGRWSFFLVPLRWLSNESEIEDARQRLAQYASHLSAALEVLGRRNDIALRTKLQSIEEKLCSISPPHAEPPPAHSTRSLLRIPRKQTKAIFPPIQANHANKALVKYTPGSEKAGITTPSSPNASLPLYPAGVYPKIWIYEQPDHTYSFETDDRNLQSIVKPALFLQDHLITALDTMRTRRVVRITSTQAEQFRLLFDLLVACAHSACADAVLQQYSQALGPFEKRHLRSGREGIVRHGDSRSRPASLEEGAITLDTTMGTIRANILSGRWDGESNTLAFTFQYLGSVHRGLSPFVVEYRSQALWAHSPPGPPLFYERDPSLRVAGRSYLDYLSTDIAETSWTLVVTIETLVGVERGEWVLTQREIDRILRMPAWFEVQIFILAFRRGLGGSRFDRLSWPADQLGAMVDRRDPHHILRQWIDTLMTLLPPVAIRASFYRRVQRLRLMSHPQNPRVSSRSLGSTYMISFVYPFWESQATFSSSYTFCLRPFRPVLA